MITYTMLVGRAHARYADHQHRCASCCSAPDAGNPCEAGHLLLGAVARAEERAHGARRCKCLYADPDHCGTSQGQADPCRCRCHEVQ